MLKSLCVCEREREKVWWVGARERLRKYICVWKIKCFQVCVGGGWCVCVRKKEGKCVCVCVCACVYEREKDRDRKCAREIGREKV